MKTLVTVAYCKRAGNNFALTAVNKEKQTLDYETWIKPQDNGEHDWGAVAAWAMTVANNWTRVGEGWLIVGPSKMLEQIPPEFRYVAEKKA